MSKSKKRGGAADHDGAPAAASDAVPADTAAAEPAGLSRRDYDNAVRRLHEDLVQLQLHVQQATSRTLRPKPPIVSSVSDRLLTPARDTLPKLDL
jgi:hypothetical protein